MGFQLWHPGGRGDRELPLPACCCPPAHPSASCLPAVPLLVLKVCLTQLPEAELQNLSFLSSGAFGDSQLPPGLGPTLPAISSSP